MGNIWTEQEDEVSKLEVIIKRLEADKQWADIYAMKLVLLAEGLEAENKTLKRDMQILQLRLEAQHLKETE